MWYDRLRQLNVLDWLLALAALVLTVGWLASLFPIGKANSQEVLDGHMGHHSVGHDKLHRWYKKLMRPDKPYASCCNDQDCRPTQARKLANGQWEAMRDGNWITIPPEKVNKEDSYDTQAHLCAPPPGWVANGSYSPEFIFCFVPPSDGL